MASYEEVVSRHGRLYRSKLDAFIRLTVKMAEMPSDDEGDGFEGIETSGLLLQGRTHSPSSSSSHHHHHQESEITAVTETATAEAGDNCCCNSSPHGSSSCSSSSCSPSSSPSNSQATKGERKSQSKSSSSQTPPPSSPLSSSASHYHQSSFSLPSGRSSSTTIDSRSIISDIFTGQLENTVRCTVCDSVSVTVEPFQDLSIPISVIDRAMKGNGSGGNKTFLYQRVLSNFSLTFYSFSKSAIKVHFFNFLLLFFFFQFQFTEPNFSSKSVKLDKDLLNFGLSF